MMAPATRTRQQDHGFVLVGVIMLVLALTILGLSLFALSSYEAQFLGHSADQLEAFHSAAGGVERAKFALAVTGRLESVQRDFPPNVDSTMAYQERSGGSVASSGDVVWDPNYPVLIRVHSLYRGVSKVVQASFTPVEPMDLYKRLVTCSDTLFVKQDNAGSAPGNRWPQEVFNGEVYLGNTQQDISWVGGVGGTHPVSFPLVPRPTLDEYLASRWAMAQSIQGGSSWSLGAPDQVTYYKTAALPGADYSMHVFGPTSIQVSGTVVWMFDRGFRSEEMLDVTGSGPSPVLIMVGKPTTARDARNVPYDIGLWFFGSIYSHGVPIILVSDHEVRIEHFNNTYADSRVDYLSIYAHKGWLLGPLPLPPAPAPHMRLSSPPDSLIDRLTMIDVLPNQGPSSRRHLSFVAGSWTEPAP